MCDQSNENLAPPGESAAVHRGGVVAGGIMVEPWTIYSKNGWHVVVHDVRDGQVYYQRWPPGVDEQPFMDNLSRTSIEQFEAAVEDATITKGGESNSCEKESCCEAE